MINKTEISFSFSFSFLFFFVRPDKASWGGSTVNKNGSLLKGL